MSRGDHFLPDLDRLIKESETVRQTIVIPGWTGAQHGMPDTLYGYMMGAFARIDLYAVHWCGTFKQANRLVSYMCNFVQPDRFANALAVQFWRHKLMHTSAPRSLLNPTTGQIHQWLLHWGDEHLPRVEHFKFQDSNRILNPSLAGLLDDVRVGLVAYIDSLNSDPHLQKNFDLIAGELESYQFRIS